MVGTIFVPFVLLGLRLTAFELGIALAFAGATAFVGSLLAVSVGMRFGAGRTVIACRMLYPIAWAIVALAPDTAAAESRWMIICMLAAGQSLYGLAMGLENANEMAYRQAITPDELQGRVNTTMRSANRAMIVVGAPVGGLLADAIGFRPTFWIAIAGFALVSLFLSVSPFRHARHSEEAISSQNSEFGGVGGRSPQ
jgi:predicted MFS family arabinose efflux permease